MSESPANVPTAAGLVARDLRAMNTDIHLVASGSGAEQRLRRAAAWIAAFEQRFSRFLPDSELSRLNAVAGEPFRASPAFFRLVALALEFAQRSDGLFDPTILRSLVDAGYDRSFELLPAATSHAAESLDNSSSWRDVRMDPVARIITLPPHVGIDLGGIGKGYAVDRLASMLATPSLVNCGGDVVASGRPPHERGWRVGVADPLAPDRDLTVLTVSERAVATSSTMSRRWQAGGTVQHHLIDPRTARPSDSDAVQVTVIARTAVEADFQAKVALIHGAVEGARYLNAQPGIEGITVRSDGAMFQTQDFAPYWRD